MTVRFLFKNNIPVCCVVISIANEINQIIPQVQKIKGEYKQFQLLTDVYLFMIQKYDVCPESLINQNKRKNCNSRTAHTAHKDEYQFPEIK